MKPLGELPTEVQLRRRGALQTFSFGHSSVSVTTRDVVRRSTQTTTDYLSLDKHPATVSTARSNWWLAAGAAFTVGASIQIAEGAYTVGDIIVSVIWCGAIFAWWWFGRQRWRGYMPVMAWDVGDRTDELLDILQKRRVAFSVDRIVRRDPEAAVQYILGLADEGLIDDDFVAELIRPDLGEDYRPGTYL